MAKLLCTIPLLYPILAELDVEAIIERYCPTEAEVNIGAVIVILCLNRPVAPRPFSGVADWTAKTVIEELAGFVDGSVQVRVEPLNRRQREVVRALGQIWWPVGLAGLRPVLPECPLEWQEVPEKVPLPP